MIRHWVVVERHGIKRFSWFSSKVDRNDFVKADPLQRRIPTKAEYQQISHERITDRVITRTTHSRFRQERSGNC